MARLEWNEEDARAAWREEALEEGRQQGRAEGVEEGRQQGRAEGVEEGRQQGRAEGVEEGVEKAQEMTKIVIQMLYENVPVFSINQKTGVSVDYINYLKNILH